MSSLQRSGEHHQWPEWSGTFTDRNWACQSLPDILTSDAGGYFILFCLYWGASPHVSSLPTVWISGAQKQVGLIGGMALSSTSLYHFFCRGTWSVKEVLYEEGLSFFLLTVLYCWPKSPDTQRLLLLSQQMGKKCKPTSTALSRRICDPENSQFSEFCDTILQPNIVNKNVYIRVMWLKCIYRELIYTCSICAQPHIRTSAQTQKWKKGQKWP